MRCVRIYTSRNYSNISTILHVQTLYASAMEISCLYKWIDVETKSVNGVCLTRRARWLRHRRHVNSDVIHIKIYSFHANDYSFLQHVAKAAMQLKLLKHCTKMSPRRYKCADKTTLKFAKYARGKTTFSCQFWEQKQ